MSASTLRLYEATDALATVREWVQENEEALIAAGGDLAQLPELQELIDQAEGDFKHKVEAVALFIRELLSTADSIDAEAKRLSARASGKKRAADGLKSYLLTNMIAADVPKIEGTLVTVRVQNSPPAVHCSLTPDELALAFRTDHPVAVYIRRVPEQFMIDASAVKSELKAGTTLPECITVTQSKHVRIA